MVGLGLVILALLIGATIASLQRSAARREAAVANEVHSLEVMLASKAVLSALHDVQIARPDERLGGTGNAGAAALDADRRTVAARLQTRARLAADNPRQTANVARLASLAADRLSDMDRSLQAPTAAKPVVADDVAANPAIRRQLAAIDAEEARLLAARRTLVARLNTDTAQLSLLLSVQAVMLLAGLGLVGVQLLRRRERQITDVAVAAADARLAESRSLLQTIIDESEDVIYVKDRDGAFVFANRAAALLLDAAPEVMIGRRDRDFLSPEIADAIEAVDARVMATGQTISAEEIVPRNGEPRIFLSAKAPWNVRGQVAGLIGISRDITDRKGREVEMQQSNQRLEAMVADRTADLETTLAELRREAEQRAAAEVQVRQMQKVESIGQLTGGIAHDFNNMLAIILGSLRLVRRRLVGSEDPKILAFLDHAEDGANRAAALTARLLAFSRQQPLAPAPIDANSLVSSVSDMLRRTLDESVEIETVLTDDLWRAFADAAQVESAIVNLAVNARDAMPGGGTLTIETANAALDDDYAAANEGVAAGQYVAICVSDTGSGMTPDVIDRAFEPFFTTKPVGQGTGLGLSQVFGFTRQSGGHLKICSEIGHGTTVKIYLPRHHGPDVAIVPDVDTPEAELPTARALETILVVEDEDRVRQIASASLRELGYSVITAANGPEALLLLDSVARVDLLFIDVVMPQMDGRRLADAALARHPALRVLFTTGYTRNAIIHNGVLDSGTALLQKPYTFDQLARKVRALLDAPA